MVIHLSFASGYSLNLSPIRKCLVCVGYNPTRKYVVSVGYNPNSSDGRKSILTSISDTKMFGMCRIQYDKEISYLYPTKKYVVSV